MPDVLMPRLSDTMAEGMLSQWLKHEGDQVRRGDLLAVIETDKAAMEMEAYDEGVLSKILVAEGQSAPIGTPIAVIGTGDGSAAAAESASSRFAAAAAAPAPAAPAPAAPAPAAPPAPPEPTSAAQEPRGDPGGRTRTSPLARKLARQHGIDLAGITGTGPGGRIVRADVEDAVRGLAPAGRAAGVATPTRAAIPAPAAAGPVSAAAGPVSAAAGPASATAGAEEVPLSAVRRITAQRLAESAREAPHFYLTVEAAADELLAFRAQANDRGAGEVQISVTDLLVRACAVTLRAHPEANASWGGDRIWRHRQVNVGVAVAIDDGLVVPVIRDADAKTLTQIAREAHALAEKARARRLAPGDYADGTFTISNLGMYGIRQFTAVINPPQAAILAVGAAVRQPAVSGDQVVIATTMALTLSIDHRVLDGVSGATFLADLRALVEQPMRIVI